MRSSLIVILLFVAVHYAMSQNTLQLIIDDIYGQLSEDDASDVDYEQLYDDLIALTAAPIDINNATDDDLKMLPFLTHKQRDDIRYFVDQYGAFHNIYELQLINSLAAYDIRNMEPFIAFLPKKKAEGEQHKWSENIFTHARHAITARADYRSTAQTSPYYITLRYQLSSSKKLHMGFSATKYAGQEWQKQGFNHYGIYAQMNNINKVVERIVIGNYRADFGQGLAISSRWMSGMSQITALSTPQGLRARSSASQTGTYLTGAGITLRPLKNMQITAFYSFRHIAQRDTNQNLIGIHAAYRWQYATLGATVLGRMSQALRAYQERPYTANYNTRTRDIVASVDYGFHYQQFSFNGETAFMPHAVATQNIIALTPSPRWTIIMLQRYYSEQFDNPLAKSFSNYSRINDEQGLYLGLLCRINSNIMLKAYGDGFATKYIKSTIYQPTTGFDYVVQLSASTKSKVLLDTRLRWKRTHENYLPSGAVTRSAASLDKASVRFTISGSSGPFSHKTQINGTLALHQHGENTLGAAVSQYLKYSFPKLSLGLQFTAFKTQDYDTRIYTYENDILYAFSMPALQGEGVRLSMTAIYQITQNISLSAHYAQTRYSQTTSGNLNPYVLRLMLRAVF